MSLATATTVAEVMLFITWACLTIAKKKHALFDQVFFNYTILVDIFTEITTMSFCEGFLDTVQAAKPPVLSFFKGLPTYNWKRWAIYVLVLEKDDCFPLVYIGSGTDAVRGVRSRMKQHVNGHYIPKYAKIAKRNGYKITHIGLLLWCDIPEPTAVPRTRLLFLALESALTFLFWAMYKAESNPEQDYDMGACFYWDKKDLTYGGLCSHDPLRETVNGDVGLTPEQIKAMADEVERRTKEYNHKYNKKYYAECVAADPDFLEAKRLQVRANYTKKMESRAFWCDICQKAAANPSRFKRHNDGIRHKQRAKKHAAELRAAAKLSSGSA
jgi:hypothetical protein